MEGDEFVIYRGRLVEILQWEKETTRGEFDWWWIRDFETGEEELAVDDEFSHPLTEMEVIAWAARSD